MTAHRPQASKPSIKPDHIVPGPELLGFVVTLRAKVARVRGLLRQRISRGRMGGQSPILGSRVSLAFAGAGHAHFGEGVVIGQDFTGVFAGAVSFGHGVYVNRGCHFVALAGLDIGADVRFGERVSIHDESHIFEPLSETAAHRGDYRSQAISIGDRVWVGANVVILPGVHIGADTVIAAGAVVRKDIPAGVLAAGVPATVVRELRA